MEVVSFADTVESNLDVKSVEVIVFASMVDGSMVVKIVVKMYSNFIKFHATQKRPGNDKFLDLICQNFPCALCSTHWCHSLALGT